MTIDDYPTRTSFGKSWPSTHGRMMIALREAFCQQAILSCRGKVDGIPAGMDDSFGDGFLRELPKFCGQSGFLDPLVEFADADSIPLDWSEELLQSVSLKMRTPPGVVCSSLRHSGVNASMQYAHQLYPESGGIALHHAVPLGARVDAKRVAIEGVSLALGEGSASNARTS